MSSQHYSLLDRFLISFDNGIRTLWATAVAQRPNPSDNIAQTLLSRKQQKQSAALMRVNHTGEICAQALYSGQALTARSFATKKAMETAAIEEMDHLAWCQERLAQLNDRVSYLNPFWYAASFSLGLLSGMMSDRWSLGFVVETEHQVERHLLNHLATLALEDGQSRAILEAMRTDEVQHATVALSAGAMELPDFIKAIMRVMSKIMTKTAYYV